MQNNVNMISDQLLSLIQGHSGLKSRFGEIAKKEIVAEGVNSCDRRFCSVSKTANNDDRSFLQHSRVKQYACGSHFYCSGQGFEIRNWTSENINKWMSPRKISMTHIFE